MTVALAGAARVSMSLAQHLMQNEHLMFSVNFCRHHYAVLTFKLLDCRRRIGPRGVRRQGCGTGDNLLFERHLFGLTCVTRSP
eukprot:scaffold795_cov187-Amphora_coffeaeformis.AAC.17